MGASCKMTAEERRDLAQALSAKYPAFPALSPPEAGIIATLRTSSRAGWRFVKRANRRLETSLLGDAIGCACLFGALWLGLVCGWVLQ